MEKSTQSDSEDKMYSPPSLTSLPIEVAIQYYGRLNYSDLENLCRTDKSLERLCRDPYFWTSLIKNRFPNTKIPENENPRVLYESLLPLCDIVFKWRDVNDGMDYSLKYSDAYTEDAISILDAYELFVDVQGNGLNRNLELTYKSNLYEIVDPSSFFDQLAQLRRILGLPPSGIKRYPNYPPRDPYDLLEYDIKHDNNNNYFITIDDVLGKLPRKLSEFNQAVSKYLSRILEVLSPLAQNVSIYLYQPYIPNHVYLVRSWVNEYSEMDKQFRLVKLGVPRFVGPSMKSYGVSVEDLWNKPFDYKPFH
jgi:hypothetical protein